MHYLSLEGIWKDDAKSIYHLPRQFLLADLFGYVKGISFETALLLSKQWEITMDNRGFAAARLIDLSRDFDAMNHGLLIAKLLWFRPNFLETYHSYL